MPVWAVWIVDRLKHYAVYLIFTVLIFWLLYAGFWKPVMSPLPTTHQEGTISNYNLQPKSYFGCTNWQIKPDHVEE
jgi:hypothetical protein